MPIRFLCCSFLLTIGLASVGYAQRSEWPVFGKNETYPSIRKKLIKAGWKPNRENDADPYFDDYLDANGKQIRATYPELSTCSGTGVGYCLFTWLSPRKRQGIITTIGGEEFHYFSRTLAGKK